MNRINTKQDGLTLLIALLLTGIILAISATLLNITLKQFQLASIARGSEIAFQAANAGMECVLYHDYNAATFDTIPNTNPSMSCMGSADSAVGSFDSGDEQQFEFEWGFGENTVCTNVSVYKFYDESSDVPMIVDGINIRPSYDCPEGLVCTVVQSRGYNSDCSSYVGSLKVVERELTYVY